MVVCLCIKVWVVGVGRVQILCRHTLLFTLRGANGSIATVLCQLHVCVCVCMRVCGGIT